MEERAVGGALRDLVASIGIEHAQRLAPREWEEVLGLPGVLFQAQLCDQLCEEARPVAEELDLAAERLRPRESQLRQRASVRRLEDAVRVLLRIDLREGVRRLRDVRLEAQGVGVDPPAAALVQQLV